MFAEKKYYSDSGNQENTLDLNIGSIRSIFKRDTYKKEVFEEFLIPIIKDNLITETWGRPYIHSRCSVDGDYSVKNVNEISIPGTKNKDGNQYNWDCYHDHSKWFI